MARIRSIKPEFPQSESMGNVSRDARLTFVQLWTLADDEGRLRGNSRMLASLLFPYDDDAPGLIDGWLAELETEGCIVRYKSGAQSYVQVCNWLIHQKIDKPSKSKIPPFEESSRILANPLEVSSEDQGSRIKDQGEERTTTDASAPAGDGDGPAELESPNAAPMLSPQNLPVPADPAVALAVALRPLGVTATSMHPIVLDWAARGVGFEVLTEAIRLAREHKGDQKIPPQYLSPIVERLLNPQPDRRAMPRQVSTVNEKFNFSHLDRSGDRAAMEASMARHGITVPDNGEEIEI
jgi:hypothetical protein